MGVLPLLVSCALGSTPSTDKESTTAEGTLTAEASIAPTITATTIGDPVSLEPLWQQTIASFGSSLINGGVGVSDGKIFGVMADSYAGTISIWNWDTNQFVVVAELTVEDGWTSDFWGIDNVQVIDLNSDSNDDIFVEYHLNDYVGKVFSQTTGSWNTVTFDGYEVLNSPNLSGSIITSYELTCLPSCAEGPAIPITYSWNGSEFSGTATDAFGDTFTMAFSPICQEWIQNEIEPFKLCDTGEAIRYLQQILQDTSLLLFPSDNPVYGDFGPETEYSVKAYQFALGLPVTGTVEGQWYHDIIEGYNMSIGISD